MIETFRLEAVGNTREASITEAAEVASSVISLLKERGQRGEWECTDDVTSRARRAREGVFYRTRMKFIYWKKG